MHIVVIGSGVAGLTAGAYLAQRGHQVTIFEQYRRPGGVTAPVERDNFKWDLGQLLVEGLGPDEPTGRILADLNVADQIEVVVDDRRYVFPDFDLQKPETYRGIHWRMMHLKTLFPAEQQGLDRYWRDYLRFTRLMTFARRMEQAEGMAKRYWQARLYLQLLPFLPKKDWSAQRLMDHYFSSRELQCVFISILADFFTPPSQFPGLGVFALNPEASFEKRMPRTLGPNAEQLYHYSVKGGISTLVDALVAKIEAAGGQVILNTAIEQVLVDDGRVTGVRSVDGILIPAEVIIASGGAQETFLKLVGEQHLAADFAQRVRDLPLMDSVFMVHLGLDYDPTPYVGGAVTYYYGTYDIEGGIAEAKEGIYHEGEKGFVVHLPTAHTPDMAPAGHHAMTIYTICPDTLQEGSWEEKKEEYADKLVQYAEQHIPGLSEHVRVCDILTPADFRWRTHTAHHAFGGLAPMLGAAKIPHQTPIEGLWFVGAQSESGGGINNVIPAAYRVAKQIHGR